MSKYEISEFIPVLKDFNSFHDSVITNIQFIKDRDMDINDGAVIVNIDNKNNKNFKYFESLSTITITVFHSNYKIKETNRDNIQIIHYNVSKFNFSQNENEDFSLIFEVVIKNDKTIIYKNEDKKEFLSIMCENIEIKINE